MAMYIETKEIPAKTIKTGVINVPNYEWQKMRWQRFVLNTGAALIFLSFFFGGLTNAPSINLWLQENLIAGDIDSASGMISILGVSILFSIAFSFIVYKPVATASKLEENLLKKHDWDGKFPYRVELEYPQHFPLD